MSRIAMRIRAIRREMATADAEHATAIDRILNGRDLEELCERDLMHTLNYLAMANSR